MAGVNLTRGTKPLLQLNPSTCATLHSELGISHDYAQSRGLLLQLEANEADLVSIPSRTARQIRLTILAAEAWERLHTAAARANISLIPLSGFRSIARQAEIIRAKLVAGQAITDILRYVAAPGFSEHHTGRALDLATPGSPPLEEKFAETTAFAWLSEHAREFGFSLSFPCGNIHGIAFEPWHWCWQSERSDSRIEL